MTKDASGVPKQRGSYLSRGPGSVCWVEILTRDPPAAASFYEAVFGWITETKNTDGSSYATFKLNGEDAAGMLMMPPEVPADAPAHWATYFAVADCEAVELSVTRLGGRVERETTVITPGRFAVFSDPRGAVFDAMEFAE